MSTGGHEDARHGRVKTLPPERKKRKSAFSLVAAALLFMAVGTAFVLRQAEVMATERRLQAIQQEIQYYVSLNESLEKQIEVLKSDAYIEKTARDKLGLVMPGEVQYMLVVSRGKN